MFVEIGSIRVYYEAIGSGQPVVLLHGWGTDSQSMRPVFGFLRRKLPVSVYALDFPGFGLTRPPQEAWEIADFTSMFLCFLDSLGLRQVDIVAHSFGGRVAIRLAAEHPERVRRLVLVDSAGIRPNRTAGYYIRVYLAKLTRMFVQKLPDSVGTMASVKIGSLLGSMDYRNAGEMRQTLVKVVNEDLRSFLPAIKCPTLLIWGQLDTQTPLKDALLMQRMIPLARLEILEGAGHFSYMDDFPSFSRVLESFLGGCQ